MGESTVNGDMPQSAFLDHAYKYPVVSDSISAFQSNPYGQKSIDITNALYARFVKPAFPYLETPASYAKPYVAKIDQIGDSLLTKVEEKAPIVKSETQEIKGTIFEYAGWPLKFAGEQKDYVLSTYNEQYKKNGGDGIVAGGRALFSGSLVITSDYLSFLASFLQKAKKESEDKAKEATETVKEKTDN